MEDGRVAVEPSGERLRMAGLGAAVVLGVLATIAVHLVLGTGAPVRGAAVAVGMVADGPTVYDGGFNWSAYQGLLRAESELGIVPHVYTSTSSADFGPNFQQCVNEENALCIGVTFFMADAISEAAAANTGTYFAIVDTTLESYGPNLRGLIFPPEEAAYLAGTLAGLMTESGVVGGIGGMEIPSVVAYLDPYRNGAQRADGAVTVPISYTGTFGDPALGAQVAQEMLGGGADVIFAAAGPTGNGALLTTTQSGAWAIGVDVDQYLTVFMSGTVPGADKLLTSAMKKIDNAVFQTISDVVSSSFTPGTAVYDLAADGVGLAPFHEAGPSVPQDVRDALEATRQGILDGTIDVNRPYLPHATYLPLVVNESSP